MRMGSRPHPRTRHRDVDFAPVVRWRTTDARLEEPQLREIDHNHYVACHHPVQLGTSDHTGLARRSDDDDTVCDDD